MAVQALEDVHFRGCYECLPDVMLVAGAIRNSIKDTPSGKKPLLFLKYSFMLGESLLSKYNILWTINVGYLYQRKFPQNKLF